MLSIVVSWRDRAELGRALPGLVEAARRAGGDVTVVNFGGSEEMLREQLGILSAEDLRHVRVVQVENERYFNKACAQNLGAVSSGQPVLFFCDCDIVVEPEGVRRLAARLHESPGHFATLAGVRESELNSRGAGHVVCFGYELKIRTADGRELKIVDNEEDAEEGTRQAPGLLFARRADFLTINGYNARLHGWGWEDQDMISRLTLGAGLTRIQEGTALHLSHGDDARIGNYPPCKDRWESRDRMFRQALANYDRADFRGTYDLDTAEKVVRVVPAARV
jgi:predicted glycosyltransferase involved in capsule biosynthesis